MKSFTYLIGWSALDKWYYGARYSKKCAPEDLWTTYFTSSERVAAMRAEHGEPDVVEIRQIFAIPEDALNWEVRVLKRLKVLKNDKWLNGYDGSCFNKQKLPPGEIQRRNKLISQAWTPEKRARVSAKWTPERRQRASKMMSEREIVPWTPERRERLASTWTPERREKFSQSKKDRWEGLSEERKAEIRAAKNAGIKASWERRRLAKAERTI